MGWEMLQERWQSWQQRVCFAQTVSSETPRIEGLCRVTTQQHARPSAVLLTRLRCCRQFVSMVWHARRASGSETWTLARAWKHDSNGRSIKQRCLHFTETAEPLNRLDLSVSFVCIVKGASKRCFSFSSPDIAYRLPTCLCVLYVAVVLVFNPQCHYSTLTTYHQHC